MVDHLDSKRDEFYSGHPPFVWCVADVSTKNPTCERTDRLDLSRPCVFSFGGSAYMAQGPAQVAQQYKSVAHSLSNVLSPDQYNFYSLTSGATGGDKKHSMHRGGRYNQVYNDYPHEFYSREAEHFVNHYLLPWVPDVQSMDATARKQALEKLVKNFGNVTFLGFSYGNVLVQEMGNVLRTALKERGYTPAERAAVMGAMASVNIGPTFKYVPKAEDMTQISLVIANDKDSVRYTGIKPGNPDLELSPVTPTVHVSRGDHSLVYVSEGSSRLRGLGYDSYGSHGDLNDLVKEATNIERLLGSKNEDHPIAVLNQVVPPHNRSLLTAQLGVEATDYGNYYIFPSNLVGMNCARFLGELVQGSVKAAKNGASRNARSIIDAGFDRHLSPDSVRGDEAHLQFFHTMYEKLGKGADTRHPGACPL